MKGSMAPSFGKKSELRDSSRALLQDAKREGKNQALLHQKENADNLAEAENLLKDLFMDVDKTKRLQHPQANEIERE